MRMLGGTVLRFRPYRRCGLWCHELPVLVLAAAVWILLHEVTVRPRTRAHIEAEPRANVLQLKITTADTDDGPALIVAGAVVELADVRAGAGASHAIEVAPASDALELHNTRTDVGEHPPLVGAAAVGPRADIRAVVRNSEVVEHQAA